MSFFLDAVLQKIEKAGEYLLLMCAGTWLLTWAVCLPPGLSFYKIAYFLSKGFNCANVVSNPFSVSIIG